MNKMIIFPVLLLTSAFYATPVISFKPIGTADCPGYEIQSLSANAVIGGIFGKSSYEPGVVQEILSGEQDDIRSFLIRIQEDFKSLYAESKSAFLLLPERHARNSLVARITSLLRKNGQVSLMFYPNDTEIHTKVRWDFSSITSTFVSSDDLSLQLHSMVLYER